MSSRRRRHREHLSTNDGGDANVIETRSTVDDDVAQGSPFFADQRQDFPAPARLLRPVSIFGKKPSPGAWALIAGEGHGRRIHRTRPGPDSAITLNRDTHRFQVSRGRRPRRASPACPAPHIARMAYKAWDRRRSGGLRLRATLAPMQDPNYKRLFSFPRSRRPPARLPPRGGPRRTRPLLPRQAPRRVRERRVAPAPRGLRVAAAPARAMAVPAGAAGVPVHRRAAHGVAHPHLQACCTRSWCAAGRWMRGGGCRRCCR